jgi:hypothetical protein
MSSPQIMRMLGFFFSALAVGVMNARAKAAIAVTIALPAFLPFIFVVSLFLMPKLEIPTGARSVLRSISSSRSEKAEMVCSCA